MVDALECGDRTTVADSADVAAVAGTERKLLGEMPGCFFGQVYEGFNFRHNRRDSQIDSATVYFVQR
ncbi:hypothetical protein [Nocardia sienata]|uniref:hypothetical protein n=1 Tax=Nocardia sienata TaxID=248552 RepID=UPI0007A490C2|nr:hypothetical protein [Nocardia sienata]